MTEILHNHVQSPVRAVKSPPKLECPPAIILGGGANALSVARNLGRMGVNVYPLHEACAFVAHSRYSRSRDLPIVDGGDEESVWRDFLLGSQSDFLAGSVLLSCCDAGIETIAHNRDALSEKYLLDDSNPATQLAMLNKLSTYQHAVEAGVPTPKFWLAETRFDLEQIEDQLVYPLIVKPRYSHIFEGATGKKLIVARNFEEVGKAVEAMTATGTGCMIVEMIPGGDEHLCSYFTYLDEQSRPQFHFTKRIIRRYPVLMGTACYHKTDWIPELADLGNRLFKHIGLRGVANVEFKRDIRDGVYKLIECNARFTASDCLVARSGVNIAQYVYNRLTGRPTGPITKYKKGLRLWDPIRDFQAYRVLRKTGQLTFGKWAASVMHWQTFPYFQLTDPMPALARLSAPLRKRFRRPEKQRKTS